MPNSILITQILIYTSASLSFLSCILTIIIYLKIGQSRTFRYFLILLEQVGNLFLSISLFLKTSQNNSLCEAHKFLLCVGITSAIIWTMIFSFYYYSRYIRKVKNLWKYISIWIFTGLILPFGIASLELVLNGLEEKCTSIYILTFYGKQSSLILPSLMIFAFCVHAFVVVAICVDYRNSSSHIFSPWKIAFEPLSFFGEFSCFVICTFLDYFGYRGPEYLQSLSLGLLGFRGFYRFFTSQSLKPIKEKYSNSILLA
ncbi:hypothetical protein SteCoe_22347 [Stentor coeruleus]|uniref:G-protein coupled receptors family 2 profile 2 domain-containing protein n=1 Tax=Stentor coeruleus TaxID=5963 RepID=A0A1R2BM94_9CILI|nr:hypothetical protein SteCoe_22347 [Stentor coeruleus]